MLKRLGSNAAANVMTGASSMVFQLGITAVAARSFDRSTFSAWTLAYSMAAMTPLFGVNLSSAVTRQLVHVANAAHAANGPVERSAADVIRAARVVARSLMLIAIVGIGIASCLLYRNSVPLQHVGAAAFLGATLALTLGQLWQISLQPSFGWHYAREQNWSVAGLYLLVRIGALLCMWLALRVVAGGFLAAVLSIAVGNWIGVFGAERTFFAPLAGRSGGGAELGAQIRETRTLLYGFAIWSVGIAAIQYGLPPLMSILRTPDYNAFYLAYSLNFVLLGIVGSAGSALLAPLTRLRLQGRIDELSRWLIVYTALCALFLFVGLCALRLFMGFILHYWSAGMADPSVVKSYLSILGFQTLARSLGIPFANILSSAGRPAQLFLPTALEVLLGTIIAIPLGIYFGSRVFLYGVAAAGLVAAITTAAAATKLTVDRVAARSRMMLLFCGIQFTTLVLWYAVIQSR
jgi:hypothetical protein